jgi:FkbM family methyltransferase
MNKATSLIQKIYRHFFPKPKTDRELVVETWERDHGDKTLRLSYDLTPDDTVWDVGGYEGQWASDIFAKYQPTIHVFEPVHSFAKSIKERFAKNEKVRVYQYGLSDHDSTEMISLVGDRASTFVQDVQSEQATFRKASAVANELGVPTLIKLNIEGGEYPLLEDLIAADMIKDITHIQVQFHDFVPHAQTRMQKIQEVLARTHTRTYHYPFVWESWTRNVY